MKTTSPLLPIGLLTVMVVLALASLTFLYHMNDSRVQRYKAIEQNGVATTGTVTNVTTYKSETDLDYSFNAEGQSYNGVQSVNQNDVKPINSRIAVRYLSGNPSQCLTMDGDPIAGARQQRNFFKYVGIFLIFGYGLAVVLLTTGQKKRTARA